MHALSDVVHEEVTGHPFADQAALHVGEADEDRIDLARAHQLA